jgi:hypothetical protein
MRSRELLRRRDLQVCVSLSIFRSRSGEKVLTFFFVKEKASQSFPPSPLTGLFPADSSLSRRTSFLNRSTSSLFRRRSLVATPGLSKAATTTSFAENRNRRTWNSWRTPHLDAEEEAKWRVNMPNKSRRRRIAALDLAEERGASPSPRAQTPGDFEYTHLGSLQLGSLRIANGAPSPAASTRLFQHYPDEQWSPEENYFSMAEPSCDDLMMKSTKRRGHRRSKSAVAPITPPLYRKFLIAGSSRKAKTMSRIEDAKAEPLPPETEPEAVDCEDLELGPEPVRRLRVMNKSADTLATMAKEYQAEPSVFQDDQEDLYDDEEDDDDNSSLRAVVGILHGSLFDESFPILMESRLTSPFNPYSERRDTLFPTELDTTEMTKQPRRPPPTKVDSGYESGGSLFTKALQEQGDATPRIATDLLESPIPLSLSPIECIEILATSRDPISWNTHRTVDGNTSKPASLYSRTSSFCTSAPTLPNSPVSLVSKVSANSKASTPRRLQKRRPSHKGQVPAVQPCNPPAEHLNHENNSKVETENSSPPVDTAEQRGRPHLKRSVTKRPRTPSRLRKSLTLFRNKSRTKKTEEERPSCEPTKVPLLKRMDTLMPRPQVEKMMPRASPRPALSDRRKTFHGGGNTVDANAHVLQVPAAALPHNRPSSASASSPTDPHLSTQKYPGANISVRPTGRGRVVSELVNKFDQYSGPPQSSRPSQGEWEAYARLRKVRRNSVVEVAPPGQPRPQELSFTMHSQQMSFTMHERPKTTPVVVEASSERHQRSRTRRSLTMDETRYSASKYTYGAPCRKSVQYDDHQFYTADLFNVPVLASRA